MPLSHIEHFLVQTESIEKTRDWYVRVLGLREGPHPDFKFPVCWLYLGDKDVIHITEGGAGVSENRKKYVGQESTATRGSGVVDHIAFLADEPQVFAQRFEAIGLATRKRYFPQFQLFQMLFKDPDGLTIELNFSGVAADSPWSSGSENYAEMPRVVD